MTPSGGGLHWKRCPEAPPLLRLLNAELREQSNAPCSKHLCFHLSGCWCMTCCRSGENASNSPRLLRWLCSLLVSEVRVLSQASPPRPSPPPTLNNCAWVWSKCVCGLREQTGFFYRHLLAPCGITQLKDKYIKWVAQSSSENNYSWMVSWYCTCSNQTETPACSSSLGPLLYISM